jgi:hypothetical protein
MLDVIKALWDIIRGQGPAQRAKLVAYAIAPGLILGLSVSRLSGGGLAIGFEGDVAISELKTEITGSGSPSSKRGIVLIAEPVSKDFRVQLGMASKIWSSLDAATVLKNKDRLALDGDDLKVTTPLFGVNGPVTIVVDGELGKDIQVPGDTESAEDWRLSSRQSRSLVSWVLAVCFLALGMTVATVAPSVDRNKNNTSQEGTEPYKD